jgi:hypothetical protein
MPAGLRIPLGLRSKVCEHLLTGSVDRGKNFIDSRKHSVDNLGHLAPQGIEFASQLLYIPLALCITTIEIAHAASR